MSRPLRFIPEGEPVLVEVTCRTFQSRRLFRPSPALNEIIIGALACSKRRYGVRICCFAFVSNHFHLLLEVDNALQLARFMGHFNSKLAREVSRLTGWWQKIFSRRYQAILVTPEKAAQIERLSYVLAHGAKEGLVDSPRQWPGVHAVRALLGEEVLKGYWFDRTKEYAARRRREDFDRLKYANSEELTLDPLPCWKHLSPEETKAQIAALVADIEAQAAKAREKKGTCSMGAAAVLSQDPQTRPRNSKKSPAPFCHAASRDWRRLLQDAYAEFFAAFRRAAERLKAGDRNAPFPPGSFPPALPFVGG